MIGTLRYTVPRLKSRKDKHAYIKAMRQCIYLTIIGSDLYAARSRLRNHKISAKKNLMNRTTWFSDVNGSYQLACAHAIAILDSMILRFLEGGCDPDTRFIQTIGELYAQY